MGCTQAAMDTSLAFEFSPTEETVEALIEYLVSPLLPLKHSDIRKESLSESQLKSVAKQIHAAVVLYNYYHLNQNRESEFLNFDQFCNLTIMFKPSILHYMKYMCQADRPAITDPKSQLSATEIAIMDACKISKTLLNDSGNVSSTIKEWPITKVAVLLINSKKENCFLQFNDGVWSVIEKEIYFEECGMGNEGKTGKKRMRKNDEEGELEYLKLAFSAVKEVTGIESGKLKVLESHVVYSLSQAKTATRFYIVQSTKSINEDNLVPIEDVISSLQGPVVNKCSGSWGITPVVEYYYLLPYAEIISQSFSRLPDDLQIKSKLEPGNVNKEEPRDSKVAKNIHKSDKSDKCGTTLEPVVKVADDVITSPLKVSTFDQKVKETKNCGITLEPVSKLADDVITSPMIENPVDQKVKVIDNSIGDGIEIGVRNSNVSKEESRDSKVAENNIKSNKFGTTLENGSKVADADITFPMIKCRFDSNVSKEEPCDIKVSDNCLTTLEHVSKKADDDITFPIQKVKETEKNSIGNGITGTNKIGKVSDNLQIKSKSLSENVRKEEPHDNKVSENSLKSNIRGIPLKPASKVENDVITSPMIVSPIDRKLKEAENSGNGIMDANSDSSKTQDMNGFCGVDSMDTSCGNSNKNIGNQCTKPQTPLKVYRHAKRETPTNSKSNKGNQMGLKTTSMINECKDEKVVVDEKKPSLVSLHENRTQTVNHALEDFTFTVDAKKSELSQAALRALLNKRQKLSNQQNIIETELLLCDKKIQAIMQGGIGDCLGIKLEAIIDCCNELCQQGDMPSQQHTNLLVGSSLPKSLTEAQLVLRKSCQELDDICLFNNWMLPTYHTSNLNGGFVANVTVKGTSFECSGESGIQPSIHGARNAAATQVITKLQQMAGEHSVAALV